MKKLLFALVALTFFSCGNSPENTAETTSEQEEVVDVVTYHENGVVEKKGMSIGGKRHGTWESFYPTGYKWSIVNYRKGLKWGETMNFYPNGMMKWQGQYANDERVGLWIFYDTTGVILKKVDMDLVENPSDSIPN
jgi:antitoxin component YwqK of YwqJK toxin-antitoxin module